MKLNIKQKRLYKLKNHQFFEFSRKMSNQLKIQILSLIFHEFLYSETLELFSWDPNFFNILMFFRFVKSKIYSREKPVLYEKQVLTEQK